MATISKTPDAWGRYNSYSLWSGWSTSNVYAQSLDVYHNAGSGSYYSAAYLLELDVEGATLNSASLSLSFDLDSTSGTRTYVCALYKGDSPFGEANVLATQSWTTTDAGQSTAHTFSFTGLSAQESTVCFFVEADTDVGSATVRYPQAAANYSLPSLSVSIAPASVYVGDGVALSFGNRLGQTLHYTLKYSSTELASGDTDQDALLITCPETWFETAGVSASSMRVDVTVTDGLSRSASGYFTLLNPQGSTATPSSPKNTTLDGTERITFSWTVSSDWGTQERAWLQWSTNNADWTDLGNIIGEDHSWTAAALLFPGGTVYWRVKVENSFGVEGDWSSGVSFTVRYDAQSQVIPVNSPTSGIINAAVAQTFAVALEASGAVHTPFTVASATFFWRSGTSGDWTTAAMTPDGDSASITIAANTFPSGTIQWKASATDNTGRTTETAVYTLTTLGAAVEAKPVSPINTVESGTGPITFRWTYGSADGSPQAAAQLQKSADGSTWETLGSVSGTARELTVAANTFSAGALYWRVRSQSGAGDWGDWSSGVSFRVFGAPVVTGVVGDGKPFCTITWQVDGQMTYEVEVDGKRYGPYFGQNVRSYTLQEPLDDGVHTVKVRAQNRYSLWSEWAEADVNVENVPGPSFPVYATAAGADVKLAFWFARIAPIITKQPQDYQSTTLTAVFRAITKTWTDYYPASKNISIQWYYRTGPDAVWQEYTGAVNADGAATPTASAEIDGYQYRVKLSNDVGEIYSEPATFYYRSPRDYASVLKQGEWKPDTGYFLIYRDGVLIGKTYNNEFVDRFAIGTHIYKALQILPGGYYTARESAAVTVSVDAPVIAALSGGEWIPLCLTDESEAAMQITRSVKAVETWYSGARWPTVEIGEEEELSASYATFWLDEDDEGADRLEALLGQDVVLKTPKDRIIVGVLKSLTMSDQAQRRAYTIALRQMDWRDFADEA